MESSTLWNSLDVDGSMYPGGTPSSVAMLSSNNTTTSVGTQFVFVNPTTSASRVAILVTYLVTFAVGVTGNSLVLYVVVGHRQMRAKSVANYYIGNLALADINFVATLPLFCWTTYTSDWPFGDFVCKLAYSVHDGMRFVGVFTLAALSVDRYVASYYNLGRCRTTNVGRMVCAVIWLSFAVMTLPYWLYASTNLVPSGTAGRRSCRVDWPDVDRTHHGRYAASKLNWIRVGLCMYITCITSLHLLCQ